MAKPYTVDTAFLARKKIYQAVFEIDESADFSNFSVSTLCDLAAVPRSTFYRHFPSLEVFFWCFLDDALNDMMAGISTHLSFFEAFLLQYTKFSDKNLPYHRILRLADRPLLVSVIQKRMEQQFTDSVLEVAPEMLDEALCFEIKAVSRCLPPILLEWIDKNPSESATLLASKALSVIPERLLGVTGNAFL